MTEKEYTDVYNKNFNRLFFSANYVLKDAEAAEDCLADVFATVWEKRDSLKIGDSLLSVMVKHRVYNYIKEKKIHDKHHSLIKASASEIYEQFDIGNIRGGLAEKILNESKKLTPGMKKVFDAMFVKGRDAKEIANELNLSINTVRVIKKKLINKFIQFVKSGISVIVSYKTKLSDKEKADVREKYFTYHTSVNSLSKEYSVCEQTIYSVLKASI